MWQSRAFGTIAVILLAAVAPAYAQPAAGSDKPSAQSATSKIHPQGESQVAKNRRLLQELAEGTRQLPNRAVPPASTADGGNAEADPMLPSAPFPSALEGATKAKYEEALREYYNYHISGLRHRTRVFSWQLFSARLIFVAVLLLVLAGVYFAAVQFHTDLRRPRTPSGVEGEVGEDGNGGARTEFSASLEGIKVSSPVLGVVILVISLAFFYLYLIYIYPIENIF